MILRILWLAIGLVIVSTSMAFLLPKRGVAYRKRSPLFDTDVKVSTYNVLSSKLADPLKFTKCSPEHLESAYRVKLLESKLQQEVDSKSIICLQEISTEWVGALQSFFSKQNYYFSPHLYDAGYMGVCIAVPIDAYEIADVTVQRIADIKLKKRPIEAHVSELASGTNVFEFISSIKSRLFSWLYGTNLEVENETLNEYPEAENLEENIEDEVWELAMRRENVLVAVNLVCKRTNKSFVVGTYHVPWKDEIKVIHSALAAQYMQQYAGPLPFILTGDFNSRPFSSAFSLLTSGHLDKEHHDYPTICLRDVDWEPTVDPPLLSAYHPPVGSEGALWPVDVVDYIFHSSEWEVKSVGDIPLHSSLPNAVEPSDHLLLSATLSLQDP